MSRAPKKEAEQQEQAPPSLAERLSAMRDRYYQVLKDHDFNLYKSTIQSVEAVALNHRIDLRAASDFESTAVLLVCQALKIKPDGD